jgi:hypothetical protein
MRYLLGTRSAYNDLYLNRGLIKINSDKTPYELWKGRSANVKHFREFGIKCCIKMEDKKIEILDSRVDEGIFFGYSCKRKAYKYYDIRLNKIVEIINVNVDETYFMKNRKENINSNIFEEQENEELNKEEEEEEQEEQEEKQPKEKQEERNQQYFQTPSRTPNCQIQKNHPPEHAIRDRSVRV